MLEKIIASCFTRQANMHYTSFLPFHPKLSECKINEFNEKTQINGIKIVALISIIALKYVIVLHILMQLESAPA